MSSYQTIGSGSRWAALRPTRDDLVDAGALTVLGLIAIIEFHTTYTGWSFLFVGGVGLFLGLAIAHVANVFRAPIIVVATTGVAVFFLLGGAVALHGAPGASYLPNVPTLDRLASSAIHGWRELVTTLPPVDGSGALLVIPYILGLFLGVGGFVMARRLQAAVWPAVMPLSTLVAVILLGSLRAPSSIVLIAGVFAVTTLLWVVIRRQRLVPVVSSGSGTTVRFVSGAVLLGLAAGTALLLGPNLPGADAHDRVVVRRYAHPPLDLGAFPSPLAEYRLYAGPQLREDGKPAGLIESVLFTINGTLPKDAPIRFATLDHYNGTVWAAQASGDDSGALPNSFLKVGPRLDNPVAGQTYTMDVAMKAYDDYWMPTAGSIQGVTFTDPNAAQQTKDFRYNLATATGVAPGKLRAGDSYRLEVAAVQVPDLKGSDTLAGDASPEAGGFLKQAAESLAGKNGNVATKVLQMASQLKSTGFYTHGDPRTGFEFYLPGHSQGRLTGFAKGIAPGLPSYVGDDEQYAAAYALMITDLGVPARVVVGVPAGSDNRVVKGSDVQAWVEVRAVDRTWRTIPASAFRDTTRRPIQTKITASEPKDAGSIVAPPAQGRPKTTLDDSSQGDTSGKSNKRNASSSTFHIPGWVWTVLKAFGYPLLVVALYLGLVALFKAVRRRRRRFRGSPSMRLARAWLEVTDHARDLGTSVPRRATRREQARVLAQHPVMAIAHQADARIFGGGELTDAHAAALWTDVETVRRSMTRAVGVGRRIRALANLSTLLPSPKGLET